MFGGFESLEILFRSIHLFCSNKEDYNKRKAIDPSIPEEEFIEFMPKQKPQIPMTPLALPTDAPKIGMCYAWEFIRHKGRKSLWGGGAGTLLTSALASRHTAVWCRAIRHQVASALIILLNIIS